MGGQDWVVPRERVPRETQQLQASLLAAANGGGDMAMDEAIVDIVQLLVNSPKKVVQQVCIAYGAPVPQPYSVANYQHRQVLIYVYVRRFGFRDVTCIGLGKCLSWALP